MCNNCLGFDVRDLSEDAPDDVEGMEASAAHVANLLSTEPADSTIFICSFFAQPPLYFCVANSAECLSYLQLTS